PVDGADIHADRRVRAVRHDDGIAERAARRQLSLEVGPRARIVRVVMRGAHAETTHRRRAHGKHERERRHRRQDDSGGDAKSETHYGALASEYVHVEEYEPA